MEFAYVPNLGGKARNSGILLAGAAVFILASAPALAQDADDSWLALLNTTDTLSNVSGGVRAGTRVLNKFDASASWFGNHGFKGFLSLQATSAADFNALTGSAQGISNIDAPAGGRISNAWIAKDFNDKGGIKLGLLDLNSEFDVQRTGALFLNPSHGIGPDFSQTGSNGPSIFPSTGLAVTGWLMAGHWELRGGVFEGQPGNPNHPGRTEISFTSDEGVLLAAEARNHLTPTWLVGLGGWHYTSAVDRIDGAGRSHGNNGLYAVTDATLAGDEEAGLNGWLRTGIANGALNDLSFYAGGGLVWTAPWQRESDQMGFAVGHTRFGGAARQAASLGGVVLEAETALELTYSTAVSDFLMLQPDLQYVLTPGGDTAAPNALVVGLRAILSKNY